MMIKILNNLNMRVRDTLAAFYCLDWDGFRGRAAPMWHMIDCVLLVRKRMAGELLVVRGGLTELIDLKKLPSWCIIDY
jgi:hypothetical protein